MLPNDADTHAGRKNGDFGIDGDERQGQSCGAGENVAIAGVAVLPGKGSRSPGYGRADRKNRESECESCEPIGRLDPGFDSLLFEQTRGLAEGDV